MRCDDLTRELASPTGVYSPAEMAGHLADCPNCAEWSRQAARFDQIWEATRPTELTPPMIDALWASTSAALEARPAAATLRLEGIMGRRRWLKPALLLAQAAALLAVAGLFLARNRQVEPVQVVATPVKNVVPLPLPVTVPDEIKPTQVAVNPPVPDMNSPEMPSLKLVVDVGETLVVSIGAEKKDGHKVERLPEIRADSSTLIPPGTAFDVFNAAETMVVTSL